MSGRTNQADEWIRKAQKAGWRVEMCSPVSHSYAKLYPPDKRFGPISLMGTPGSGGRTRKNERARLKRAGLDV